MASTGDRIREVRATLGITQDELAEKTGISKGFLSDVENNNRNISSEYLLRIANALGASIDYLLRGEKKESSRVEPVVIPPELSQAAEELKISYPQTLELLEAHRSIVGRRSTKRVKRFTPEDWKQLHKAIRRVFG